MESEEELDVDDPIDHPPPTVLLSVESDNLAIFLSAHMERFNAHELLTIQKTADKVGSMVVANSGRLMQSSIDTIFGSCDTHSAYS
jgi:hypothetical protein